MKALRGNELFRKNVNDLCLVLNVKIPAKFKVPEFDKYRGNTCPRAHLVMYVRRMSTEVLTSSKMSLFCVYNLWHLSMLFNNIHRIIPTLL